MISKYHLFHYDSYRKLEEFCNNNKDYDLYISAYTKEDIVIKTFTHIQAKRKVYLIFPEYNLKIEDINCETFEHTIVDKNIKEAEYINAMCDKYISSQSTEKICIDATGFNKPYLVYLLFWFKEKGIKNIDLIYTEPQRYLKSDKTNFSDNIIESRDIVSPYESYPKAGENDLFIINIGYDSKLVNKVINNVTAKEKKPLIGFPSLQSIMYQENILNLIKSKTELGIKENDELLYAPANNPFITAHVISEYVKKYIKTNKGLVKNIHLAPLATKAQTIGMALFYIFENSIYEEYDISIHIHYPFTNSYSASSSEGLFRINKYTIEFDLFDKVK
jgi:hypothetical protein